MRQRWVRGTQEVALVTIGALLVALALNWFNIPNSIAAGGASGLATIISHWTGLSVGALSLLINLPLLVASVLVLGWASAAKTILGTTLVSFSVDAMALVVAPLTRDPLLAAISGGLLIGVGIGLSFRGGGSTGGTDVAAQLLQHRSRKGGVGTYLLMADGAVLVLAGIAFSPELALYGLVSLLITSVVIDVVLEGMPYARQALIVTKPDRAEAIAQAIFSRLGRGVTRVEGRGMYTQAERALLLVVVARGELTGLIDLVSEVDLSAFVIISDIRSVMGEGFEAPRRPLGANHPEPQPPG